MGRPVPSIPPEAQRGRAVNTITNPGVYTDFPVDDYQRDPCPTPSLTQSMAKTLINTCPLKCWHASPRLNPECVKHDESKFDLGNVAHRLLLKRGRELVCVDAPDWRTKLAQDERAAAIEDGLLPVLLHQLEQAKAMADAVHRQMADRGIISAFIQGSGEVVCAAVEAGDVWLRTMIDWMVSTVECWDYKTTAIAVAPHNLARYAAESGFDIQAAMQERILSLIDKESAGRRKFRFVVQETEPPYLLSVLEMTEAWMTMGRKKLQHAIDIWSECVKADRWPGYPDYILKLEYPGYLESRWIEREVAHEARRESTFQPETLMAG